VSDPGIFYANPFYNNEPLSAGNPFQWYRDHPLKGVATLGLHVFNIFDQDLPFPYNTTLAPWYYPYVTAANWAMLVLAFAGAGFAIRQTPRGTPERFGMLAVTALVVVQLALHAPFHVEAGYGLPSLLVLYPAAALTIAHLATRRVRLSGPILAAVCIAVLSASSVSAWVRSHSPEIRAYIDARDPDRLARMQTLVAQSRPASYVPLKGSGVWTAVSARVGPEGEAVLLCDRTNSVSWIQMPVRLRPSTDYVISAEIQSPVPLPSAGLLYMDLYGGPPYDQSEQQVTIASVPRAYESITWQLNSGANAPTDAYVRFVSQSNTPIQIRRVTVSAAASK
jgi:hypothetical protein